MNHQETLNIIQCIFDLFLIAGMLANAAFMVTVMRWQKAQDKAILGLMNREIEGKEEALAEKKRELSRLQGVPDGAA